MKRLFRVMVLAGLLLAVMVLEEIAATGRGQRRARPRKEDALFEIRYGNEPTPRLILNYPEIPDS